MVKKYIFVLKNINIDKILSQYGLNSNLVSDIPEKSTKIEDLEKSVENVIQNISFLDESKHSHKCAVSLINFNYNQFCCFWDKNPIPMDVSPIGCPIKYLPDIARKDYTSEISKERYIITETIPSNRKTGEYTTIEKRSIFETDGVFCSFNCIKAYLESEGVRNNPLYINSPELLLMLYNNITNIPYSAIQIHSAPHWRMLKEYGGHMTISEFRNAFNHVNYSCHGMISSIGWLYEGKIKL